MENESTDHKSNRKDKAGLVVAGVLAGAVVTSAGCLVYTKLAANNNPGGMPPIQQMQNGMPGGMNGQGGPQRGQQGGPSENQHGGPSDQNNGQNNGHGGPSGTQQGGQQGGPNNSSNNQGGPSENHGTPPNFQNGGGNGSPSNQGGQR